MAVLWVPSGLAAPHRLVRLVHPPLTLPALSVLSFGDQTRDRLLLLVKFLGANLRGLAQVIGAVLRLLLFQEKVAKLLFVSAEP